MGRRKDSDEYKKEVVALTQAPGATITAVAADLGINSHMLGKWRKALEQHDEKMMQLKREYAHLRKERDFLKEAALPSVISVGTAL